MVTRRESVWSNDRVRADSESQVFDKRPQRDHDGHRGCESALQAARRADAEDLTHDEPKIEATGMNQQPLQDVRVTAQMGATHPPRVIDMREGAFDRLAASTHQAPAAGSTNPATIAIHGCLRFRMLRPVASTSVGLRNIRPV